MKKTSRHYMQSCGANVPDIMQQKIEAADEFTEVWKDGDGLRLLAIIKDITYAFQNQKYTGQSLFECIKDTTIRSRAGALLSSHT